MRHGAVEFVVIEFNGQHLDPSLATALREQVSRGVINVIDLLFVQQRRVGAPIAAVAGILLGLGYFTSDDSPVEFVKMTPYVVTLVVLAVATQRLRPPAYVGRPWRKGQVE